MNKYKGYEVRAGHVILEKITDKERMSGTGFEFSGEDSEQMSVQKAKVLAQAKDVPGNDVGNIAYYMKARAYDVKLMDGSTVTLLPYPSIVMVISQEEYKALKQDASS